VNKTAATKRRYHAC